MFSGDYRGLFAREEHVHGEHNFKGNVIVLHGARKPISN